MADLVDPSLDGRLWVLSSETLLTRRREVRLRASDRDVERLLHRGVGSVGGVTWPVLCDPGSRTSVTPDVTCASSLVSVELRQKSPYDPPTDGGTRLRVSYSGVGPTGGRDSGDTDGLFGDGERTRYPLGSGFRRRVVQVRVDSSRVKGTRAG